MTVTSGQRFARATPCPICGGFDAARRGQGQRCFGFLSSDGGYAHCTREERAGGLDREADAATYAHRLAGTCRCGIEHRQTGAATGFTPRRSRIVTIYDYCDEAGELIFQVVREDPKGFRQRRPDPKRPDAWLWNLASTRRVLYRLTEVLAAARKGGRIYVVEGEKDADAISALGLTGTTSPGGAGKWRGEYAKSLRGAGVVVIADKDTPGRAHAQMVARSCSGTTTNVRVIELPGDTVKDASDFLATGGTKVELERIVDEASEWSPEGNTKRATLQQPTIPLAGTGLRTRTWRELTASADEDPARAIVAEHIAEGDTVLLYGYSGIGKSIVALACAVSIHRGEPFLDQFPTLAAHVGIIDEESSPPRLGRRLAQLGHARGIGPADDDLPLFAVGEGVRLDTDDGLELIFTWIRANELAVLIVDTLRRVHRLRENEADDMATSSTPTQAATRSTRSPATRAAPCSSCSSFRPRTRRSSRCSRASPR